MNTAGYSFRQGQASHLPFQIDSLLRTQHLRSEDVVSEIIGFALGERFESIVRPDDPQNGFHTASST
jgi:hypothetical protein